MNLGDAINQMSMIVGFRNDIQANAQAALARAQEHYEKGPIYPWFLLSENSTIVTTIGERRIPVPGNFIAEYEESALYSVDDEGEETKLGKHDSDYLIKTLTAVATGLPTSYSRDGLYFTLYPTPDDLYTLLTRYYKKDVDLATLSLTSTNRWLTYAPDVLIGWAGQNLATGYRDMVAAGRFATLEAEGKIQLQIQNEDHKHSNRQYQIGGPHV